MRHVVLNVVDCWLVLDALIPCFEKSNLCLKVSYVQLVILNGKTIRHVKPYIAAFPCNPCCKHFILVDNYVSKVGPSTSAN